MAVKKPLVLTAGQIQELQSGDEINIDASDVTTGTIATARLGSGTANNTTFLRGDQTWATPAGGETTYSVTIADAENTTTKTTVASFVVPANTWADGERMVLFISYELLNNSGSQNTLTTYVGGTGLTENSGSTLRASSAGSVRSEFEFSFIRVGSNVLYARPGNSTNNLRVYQNIALANNLHAVQSSVNFTVDITLNVAIQNSIANAATYFRTDYARASKLSAGTV